MFAPRSARETACSPDPRATSEQTVACEGHLIAGTTPQSRLRQAAQENALDECTLVWMQRPCRWGSRLS